MGIVEYFEKTTGFKATPEQIDLLLKLTDDSIKKLLVSCGRGFSKTLCCSIALLWYAEKSLEEEKAIKLMIVSPQDTMYKYCNDYFKSEALHEARVKKGVYTEVPIEGFELKNGTEGFTKPATNKVRSNRANILWIDEAADVPAEIIKSAMNCLVGDINRLILISTCHKYGYFTERACNPKKYGYEMVQYSDENCPWLTQTVARAKEELTQAEYAMEILGRAPTVAERTYFPSKHVDACIYETVLKENAPMSRLEAGLDWGFDPCHTCLVITEKIFARRKVLFIKEWAKHPIEEIAPEIAEILEKHKVTLTKADTHPPEYKHQIEKYTKIPIFYISAQMHKDAMLSQLQRKIRQHTLEVPQDFMKLIQQLRKYRRGKRTGDDQADALALSCYEPAEPLNVKPKPTVIIKLK